MPGELGTAKKEQLYAVSCNANAHNRQYPSRMGFPREHDHWRDSQAGTRLHLDNPFRARVHGRRFPSYGYVGIRTTLARNQQKTAGLSVTRALKRAVNDNPTPVALERHYTVAEVAQLWGVSKNTVRRIFKDVPGVLRIGSRKPRTRKYQTISIPERVLTATHAALTK